jgi:tetratricopeptide (TPR) repeat protein
VTTPDPIEIAMEAEASGRPPGGLAAEYLAEQKRLVRWQVANERAAFALRVLTAAAGIAVAVALGAMAWTASRSAALVIDAFSVPPELAARGVTGQVVASQILDGMTGIQNRVDSQRAPSTFSNAWDGGMEVVIPSTGITAGELMRELRSWLGRDRHVSGEIVRTTDGLALTVRVAGDASRTFKGAEAELPDLLARAAEGAYSIAEPYRWANMLRSQGRFAEAEPLFRTALVKGPQIERTWALIGLGNIARDASGQRIALGYFAAAARSDPTMLLPPSNLGYTYLSIGQPEAARAQFRRAIRNANSRGGVRAEMLPAARARVEGQLAMVEADMLRAEAIQRRGIAYGPQGANISLTARLALVQVALHELGKARATMSSPDPSQTRDLGTIRAERVLGAMRIASGTEAWAEVVSLSDVSALQAQFPGTRDLGGCQMEPLAAYALARLGDLPAALARIQRTPLDCYDAVIMRGKIAELAGDRAGADHWFGQAVGMAPTIVFAHQAWAEAKLARGDLDGALAEARIGRKLAPRFADPLAAEGEVMLARRDAKAAARLFARAAQFAPRWGRLHLKWGQALAAQGKSDEARAKWRAAASMDLTAGERAELQRMMRRNAPAHENARR